MHFILCLILAFIVPNISGQCQTKAVVLSTPQEQKAKETLLKNRQRTDLINYLIVRNNYKKYLEIGVAGGDNLRLVVAENKLGVDPSPSAPCDYHMTSDEFFAANQETFDIIFIDGLHLHEQVLRDIVNGINCLNPGGVIVMHDCMPVLPEHQGRTPVPGAWNGDVWKAAAYVRMNWPNVHFCVLDMDWGCGVLVPNSSQQLFPARSIEEMDWDFYITNRDKLLNVKSVEGWLKSLKKSGVGAF